MFTVEKKNSRNTGIPGGKRLIIPFMPVQNMLIPLKQYWGVSPSVASSENHGVADFLKLTFPMTRLGLRVV